MLRTLLIGTSFLASLGLFASAGGADERLRSAVEPQPGVLVLKSGEVLEGRVTWAGDLYYVTRPGGQVGVRGADVEMFARDLDEAYRRKRAAIDPQRVSARHALAQWCIRHGLVGPAAVELAEAMALEPDHPGHALLLRRLEFVTRRPTAPRAESTPGPMPAESPWHGRETVPKRGGPMPAAPSPAAPAPAESRNEREALEDRAASLPPAVVEMFTTTVQPILSNGCAAAGCHGAGTTSQFRFERISGRTALRHTTLANLAATLELVDRAKPEESPLVRVPRGPHGSAAAAIYHARNIAQWEQLAAWAKLVSQPAGSPPRNQPGSKNPAGAREHAAAGTSIATQLPADPFDPEVFNRRFFPERFGERAKTDVAEEE
jgi:hypothetical protein